MEDRLKQRLVGAGVVIAIAVVFVPELLKDSEEPDEPVANMEIPPRPAETIVEPDATVSLPLITGSSEEPATAPDAQTGLMRSPADNTASTMSPLEPIRSNEFSDRERIGSSNEQVSSASVRPVTPQTAAPETQLNTTEADPLDFTGAPNQPSDSSVVPNPMQLPPGVTRPEPNPPTASLPNLEATSTESATPSPDLPQVDLIGRSGTDDPPATVASVDQTSETAALTPTDDWVVQAGSFSQEENATDLRDELIEQGFDAFVESTDAEGQTLYRVRIGPQSSRSQGENTLARLRTLGFEGQVVSQGN